MAKTSCEVRLFHSSDLNTATTTSFDLFEDAMNYIRDQWLVRGGYLKAEVIYNNCLQATFFIH